MDLGQAACSLDQKCQFYLPNGLAPSTRRVYFCTLHGYVSSNGSLVPASEQILVRFCSHLADRLHHSSIKVYLSAIGSLHINQGFPDPLVNCIQLQRLLRGIKRHQGSSLPQRQPVTADLMRIIQRSLDADNSEHIMLWAACCLGFFGFLQAGEFMVNCAFDPSIHLTIQDLQVDAEVNPSSLRVHIKSSKTDPFRQGCFIYLGRGQAPLCPISAILAYLHRQGPLSGPLFMDAHGQPLTRSHVSSFIQSVLQGAGIPGHFSGHSFRIGAADHNNNNNNNNIILAYYIIFFIIIIIIIIIIVYLYSTISITIQQRITMHLKYLIYNI